MICYFAQPNRFHPFLVKELEKKYNITPAFYHITLNGKHLAFHLDKHLIEEVTIDKIYKLKNSEFITGVLHPKFNKILSPKFSFTIISNPVNRVYQLFYIFKFLETTYKKEGIIQKIFNSDNLTIELFVDRVLDNNYYRGIIEEHIFLLPDAIFDLNFVGIAEESELTGKFLSRKLKIDLKNFNFIERIENTLYRIKEIEKSLQPEIDKYNVLRSKLKNS